MNEGDEVRLVGMAGTSEAGGFLLGPQGKAHYDRVMVAFFGLAGVKIGDEGILIRVFPDGWADVEFSQYNHPIRTLQRNLEIVSRGKED